MKTESAPRRFERVADLSSPAMLAELLGPVARIDTTPLRTVGFTGARHVRLLVSLEGGGERRLVLKESRIGGDFTARRSGDRVGREALWLAEPSLAGVWSAFVNPYLAYALEDGAIALLMDDVSEHLPPDVREPLADGEELALLGAIAAMHARYWNSPALDLPWLAQPVHFAALIGPACAADPEALAVLPPPLAERVARGWTAALARLPASAARLLSKPPGEAAHLAMDLPRTLLHGDVKVANFALHPDGRVAAFDWAMLGAGPAAIDVGWYLAVNATRLARGKDETLVRYRDLLRRAMGREPLTEREWTAFVDVVVVFGALMGLWSKALALESPTPYAEREWAWWVEGLERIDAR